MRITLKNIKIMSSMSRETECFSASLWLDDKKVGEVSNRGVGGAHEFWPTSLGPMLDRYAATQPKVESAYGPLTCSADLLVNRALEEAETGRAVRAAVAEFERGMKAKLYFVGTDGKVYSAKCADVAAVVAKAQDAGYRAQRGIAKVINELPRDEAVAIYTAFFTNAPVQATLRHVRPAIAEPAREAHGLMLAYPVNAHTTYR